MKKKYGAILAMTTAAVLLTAGLPQARSAPDLGLTYTTPECSTAVRLGRVYGVYSTTILWANDGSTAEDYRARNNMACQAGVIMCTPTECSWPLTRCFQYTAQWVRVGFAGRSPAQLNLANPMCPAN
ncbi:MAG: hypothetical protein WBN23_06865 [Woeseia sp.]|jgi:hypothetical protein